MEQAIDEKAMLSLRNKTAIKSQQVKDILQI